MLSEKSNGRVRLSVVQAPPAARDPGAQAAHRKLRPQAPYPRPHPGLRAGPPQVTAESVARSQRARLYGAMIELVAGRGCGAGTVEELCVLAGVSEGTLQERFPGGMEECLLATYDMVVRRARLRILGAGPRRLEAIGEVSSARRLRRLAEAFGHEVAAYPDAARLVLVEAPRAGSQGPGLSERMERTRELAEQALAQSLRAGPDGPAPARRVLEAIVAKGTRLVGRRLREGRVERLAEELAAVCLAAAELPLPPR